MQQLTSLLSALVLAVLLTGCLPDPLDIELEQAPVKLVISSQVVPDRAMFVTVSKSFGALQFSEEEEDSLSSDEIDQLLVRNALVTVSYNGITDTLIALPDDAPGVYLSLNTPQFLNTTYTLNVYDPETDQSVSSQAEMLAQVTLDTAYASRSTTGSGGLFEVDVTTVNYRFNDPPNEDNWYMVNFYANNTDSSSAFNNDNVPTVTEVLADATFENSSYAGEVEIFDWPQDTIFVAISNISEEYYDYLNVRQRTGNVLSQVLSEPIEHPSNVIGGYGYFLTHFPDVEVVAVNE